MIITSTGNQYRNYCDIRWKLIPGLWQLATYFACTQLRCLMVISCSGCTCGCGPHRALGIGGGSRHYHPLLPASLLCSLYCSGGCRTECLVWPVWCVPANTWKTGAHKCRSNLIPQSAFYLFLKHRGCSNRNRGVCAWESHVEGTCSRGEDAYRDIHASLLRSLGVLKCR